MRSTLASFHQLTETTIWTLDLCETSDLVYSNPRNSHIGGTWYENKYPGCGCDVPAHSYTFSFEPNPEWSSFYVPAEEIRAYLENFSRKYSLDRFVCLDTTVIGADWDDKAGECESTA